MRPLKFRVYNPDEQKMMYFTIDNITFADRYLTQHKYPVQQYTGLKDKHGKEIYEGDVIRLTLNLDVIKNVYMDCSTTTLLLIMDRVKDGAFTGEVTFDGHNDLYSQFTYFVGNLISFPTLKTLCTSKDIEIVSEQYE